MARETTILKETAEPRSEAEYLAARQVIAPNIRDQPGKVPSSPGGRTWRCDQLRAARFVRGPKFGLNDTR